MAAFALGLIAVVALFISYWFHTTTVDVYALSSDEVSAAFDGKNSHE